MQLPRLGARRGAGGLVAADVRGAGELAEQPSDRERCLLADVDRIVTDPLKRACDGGAFFFLGVNSRSIVIDVDISIEPMSVNGYCLRPD